MTQNQSKDNTFWPFSVFPCLFYVHTLPKSWDYSQEILAIICNSVIFNQESCEYRLFSMKCKIRTKIWHIIPQKHNFLSKFDETCLKDVKKHENIQFLHLNFILIVFLAFFTRNQCKIFKWHKCGLLKKICPSNLWFIVMWRLLSLIWDYSHFAQEIGCKLNCCKWD